MITTLLVGFVIALAGLSLWWAFNTIRQIQLQKEFAAFSLISIGKLWRKAKFVPEDARDRESLYLYRDFLSKFDGTECKYPIMVKNGGVRCMTRVEYDQACKQKPKTPVSILLLLATVVYAVVAIILNLKTNMALGISLALIMPALQVIIAGFIWQFNRDKNLYRERLFMELKENSVDFLRITKPFIVVDAYPEKFGKNAPAKFMSRGELTDEQIVQTKQYIIGQKQAETKVVLKSVDNQAEIENLINPPKAPEPAPVVNEPVAPAAPAQPTPQPAAPAPTQSAAPTPAEEKHLTREEAEDIVLKLLWDDLQAKEQRAAVQAGQQPAPAPVATAPVTPEQPDVPETPVAVDDDFSLDSIGIALDAELAKRRGHA